MRRKHFSHKWHCLSQKYYDFSERCHLLYFVFYILCTVLSVLSGLRSDMPCFNKRKTNKKRITVFTAICHNIAALRALVINKKGGNLFPEETDKYPITYWWQMEIRFSLYSVCCLINRC